MNQRPLPSGAAPTFTVLSRNPTDPKHATDPETGRNFNWDPDTKKWVDSATGKGYGFAGYLCSTPGRASPAGNQPQATAPSTQGPPPTTATHPTSPSASQTSSTTGAGIQFQLRGFGGASLINGNTPPTGGGDGAVLFPLGNRILVGPTTGFQWVNSSIVNSIGSHRPGSKFVDTSAGFKEGNFGSVVDFPLYHWNKRDRLPELNFDFGLRGGATVAGSTITQATGFCGTGRPDGSRRLHGI